MAKIVTNKKGQEVKVRKNKKGDTIRTRTNAAGKKIRVKIKRGTGKGGEGVTRTRTVRNQAGKVKSKVRSKTWEES